MRIDLRCRTTLAQWDKTIKTNSGVAEVITISVLIEKFTRRKKRKYEILKPMIYEKIWSEYTYTIENDSELCHLKSLAISYDNHPDPNQIVYIYLHGSD